MFLQRDADGWKKYSFAAKPRLYFRFPIDYLNRLNTALVDETTVPEVGCGGKMWSLL
jgi:hypothetical protein